MTIALFLLAWLALGSVVGLVLGAVIRRADEEIERWPTDPIAPLGVVSLSAEDTAPAASPLNAPQAAGALCEHRSHTAEVR